MSAPDNPASQMPLGVTRGAGKIAAALSFFNAPIVTAYRSIGSTTPVLVAKADPFRHFLSFACNPSITPQIFVLLAPSPKPLLLSPPAATVTAATGSGQQATLLSFGNFAAMVAGEWWAISSGSPVDLYVTEQQFLG